MFDPASRRLARVLVGAGILIQVAALLALWRSPDSVLAIASLVVVSIALGAAALIPPALARPTSDARSAAEPPHSDDREAGRGPAAERRVERALSSAKIAVFAQDAELRHTWISTPVPGLTPAEVGHPMKDPEPTASLALKHQVLATRLPRAGAVSVAAPGGRVRHFNLTVTPIFGPDGAIDELLSTAVDVTEGRLSDVRLATIAAQAAATNRRFDLALEDSPITVFEQDTTLRYTFIYNPPPGTVAEDFIGRTDADLFGDEDLRKLLPLKRHVVETGERGTTELDVEVGGRRRFYSLRLEPRFTESGAVEGVIGTAVDLTERRRHEENMRLVMRELTHRSKNLLAVVQAMARKTASTAPDTETFVRDFSARLRAIAAAQDLLVAESWSGAELRDLLAASLSQTVDPEAPEIRVEGPDLKLAPDAAQMLGLAFHELAINAATHGALSVPSGRVTVRWRHEGESVRLSWSEEGGPAVDPPRRSGFGRVLLERLVGASLGGVVALEFRPSGLVCDLTFPGDRLIAA